MTTLVSDFIVCPFCGDRVIRGSDQCDACGMELGKVDVPDQAALNRDSPLNEPIGNLRISRASAVRATATIGEAVAIVAGDPTGALVVLDAGGDVIGVFTERDVLHKVAGDSARLDDPVTSSMTADPVVLREDDTMAAALNKMGEGGFRHIPVVRDGRQLVGMVTSRDVLQWLMAIYFD